MCSKNKIIHQTQETHEQKDFLVETQCGKNTTIVVVFVFFFYDKDKFLITFTNKNSYQYTGTRL